MKKLLSTFLSILLAASIQAAAQVNPLDNPNNKSHLGVRAGLDVTSLQSASNLFETRIGFQAGVVYDMPIWKNLFFEPGVSVFYNGAGIKDVVYIPDYALKGGSIKNWGLRIPMNLGYRFDLTPNIGVVFLTGPQLNLNLSSKYSFTSQLPDDFDIHFKSFDMGWNFGVGFLYKRVWLGINGLVGITHYIEKEADFYYARRNVVSVSVGYNF